LLAFSLTLIYSAINRTLPVVEPPAVPCEPQPEKRGVAEQVEELRSQIIAKTDAIRELRARLRATCVPMAVCTYLSQCIKDTDVCTAVALLQIFTAGWV